MNATTKTAGELVTGDVISANGAALTVATVERAARGMVVVTFERGCWIVQPGPARVRATAKVEVCS
jgi:riboflavin synthase alpha subunit